MQLISFGFSFFFFPRRLPRVRIHLESVCVSARMKMHFIRRSALRDLNCTFFVSHYFLPYSHNEHFRLNRHNLLRERGRGRTRAINHDEGLLLALRNTSRRTRRRRRRRRSPSSPPSAPLPEDKRSRPAGFRRRPPKRSSGKKHKPISSYTFAPSAAAS